MSEPTIYLGTPSHSGEFPFEYVQAHCTTVRLLGARVDPHVIQSSWLPRSRDLIVSRFLASGRDYLLSVDSDIGWATSDIEELLAAKRELISGAYCKKDGRGKVVVTLAPGETWSCERLLRCDTVPAGFFLMARAAAERMTERYRPLRYRTDEGEETTALHWPFFDLGAPWGTAWGEDSSFCRRFREIGGEIWMHPGVVLRHVGRHVFLPSGGP
jgi:hypothetical protein